MPYTSIVVGTDGSATAELAVRHAAQLALNNKARLVIVTAYEPQGDVLIQQEERVPDELRWALTDRNQAEEKARQGKALAAEVGLKKATAQSIEEIGRAHV